MGQHFIFGMEAVDEGILLATCQGKICEGNTPTDQRYRIVSLAMRKKVQI